jgi:6-pyruvoyltetrahydropterin/6-carboxytetrahydropterin synthase
VTNRLPFEYGVVTTFEAAHKLHGDFGHATQLHGHTYKVVVAVRSQEVREDGTIIRPDAMQRAIAVAIDELNHRYLNEVPGLAGVNTTGEELARHLWRRIAAGLEEAREATELMVEVWESPTMYSRFELPLGEGGAPA